MAAWPPTFQLYPSSCAAQPLAMQIVHVRAEVAAGGELGEKYIACRVPQKINQMAGK